MRVFVNAVYRLAKCLIFKAFRAKSRGLMPSNCRERPAAEKRHNGLTAREARLSRALRLRFALPGSSNDGNVKRQTLDRLNSMITASVGRRITYAELIA